MSVSATYSVLPSTVSEIRPIAMPATGAFNGTPALSRASVEAQTEPIEVDPLEPSASDTCRIAYGNSSRDGLTGRVRREVVVVHVALGAVRAERVKLLLQAQHVQRGDTHDLGLAAL